MSAFYVYHRTRLSRFERRLAKNKPNEPWILNDGPPYVNGDLHMGDFLNRVLKDALIKIHLLDGRWADFIPGWDMHGLPIERETLKHFGIDFHKIDPIELPAACRERALHWLDRQRSTILRESTVIVGPAAGEKYARCWKYLPIGTDPDHPAACASCATIVREIDKNKS